MRKNSSGLKLVNEEIIVDSWKQNAAAWAGAIGEGAIESRVQVTNQAIVDAVKSKDPSKVIDIGCGEGWLTRELSKLGMDVLGVDIVPALISKARSGEGGQFRVISYHELSFSKLGEKFDLAVCNFSLFGHHSVNRLFADVSTFLKEEGHFVVQTLHPLREGGNKDAHCDGWRKGSWRGFSDKFVNPAPWYFRTLESWKDLFYEKGFDVIEVLEPINSTTNEFASIIFIGRRRA